MKRYQKTLVWAFTFGFGLIWILAFFVPSEIGGDLDRAGMYGGDLVGKRLYYTTGNTMAMMDLDRTSLRRQMFSLSPFRKDDYYGAKFPSIFRIDDKWKCVYLGIGKDDKRRICLAESDDGIKWTPKSKAVYELPSETCPGGPNWIRVESSGNGYSLYYSAPFEGRTILYSAFSDDLINWSERGVISKNEENVSVLTLTQNSKSIASVDRAQDGTTSFTFFPNGSGIQNTLFDWMTRAKVSDIRFVSGNHTLFGYIGVDNRPRLAVAEGQFPQKMSLLAGSLADGSVAELGKPAFKTGLNDFSGRAAVFVQIVMNFGLGMGLISLLVLHIRRIRKEPINRGYSAVVIVSVMAMLVVQVMRQVIPDSPIWQEAHELLFFNMQFPLGATMFGLLAAFLISAAYRAFRIRTFDAAVLTAVATLVLLTQVPTAQFLASIFGNGGSETAASIDAAGSEARTWLLTVVNDAVQRSVAIGAFVGAIAMALRIWLSIEPKN